MAFQGHYVSCTGNRNIGNAVKLSLCISSCFINPYYLIYFRMIRFYCRAMLCNRGLSRHAVSVCLSVCPSRSWIVSKRIKISSKFFSPSGSHTILVLPYHTEWRYFNGNPPNGDVKCRWGRQKSWFWAYISFHCLLLMLQQVSCCQYDAAGPPSRKLWHLVVSGGVDVPTRWPRENFTVHSTEFLAILGA